MLRGVREHSPSTPVIIVTGFGELEKAVEAVREGAFDFVSKPFNITELKGLVERALQRAPAPPPAAVMRDTMPPALLGRTPAMTAVYKQIAHAASAEAPVLIIGESGTGKELVARAIHQHGNRSGRPFVPINCGALTETLLESELFGHIKGSFTGAVSDSKGVFQTAHTGTVFLDEVGEMSPSLQVKLLRVLQEGEVRAGRHEPPRQSRRPHRRGHERGRGARQSATASSARTSSIASAWSSSTCRRCASAGRTFRCSSTALFSRRHRKPGKQVEISHAAARGAHDVSLAGQRARAREPHRAAGRVQPRRPRSTWAICRRP